ncbi:hypothetical protein LWI29_023134 [Acer saccharum]|uniref:Ubiquitin-like domain-containing protein n=1 Tax=Acer saccharum TaxID=4024 RepID=A0AA39SFQ6_ACESA|nr:hypothetical protein LWI29_023134 [Acer saccharum]KAK1567346.1 hypothetical protein Q3G72_011104 [Acer saccharum]
MAATVLFKITGGVMIPEIEMPISATILELKKKIESVLKLKAERQTLRHHNQELNNGRTIAYYDFKKNVATLVLHFKPLPGKPKFNVLVKSKYDEFNVKVKETTLVADLFKEIEKRLRYSLIKNYNVYHLSTKIEEEDLPVTAYYICEGSNIEVKLKIWDRVV